MTTARYQFEPLDRHHDRAAFLCGVPELERYLKRQARQDMQRHVAAVFVLQDVEAGRIAGYYTLSAAAIGLTDLPDELSRRLPRYPDLPAVLLGRLAVDSGYQEQGFGELVLMDALAHADAESADCSTGRYCRREGRDRSEVLSALRVSAAMDQPRRLFLSMQTIAALLASPE